MDDGYYSLYSRMAPRLSEDTRIVRDTIVSVEVDEDASKVHVRAHGRSVAMPLAHIAALPTVGGELYYTTDVDEHGFIGWSLPCPFCSYVIENEPKVH